MKHCKVCDTTKPLTEFSKDGSKKDGLNAYCRVCHRARQAKFLAQPGMRDAKDGMKSCMRCKETKPVSDFGASTKTFDKFDRRCKACNYLLHNDWLKKNPERNAAYVREWRVNNLDRMKDMERKKKYGVLAGWYAETLQTQEGRCAICTASEAGGMGDFHVDHCHSSGKVRGLLCHNCNLLLGHASDDITILESAIRYVTLHK